MMFTQIYYDTETDLFSEEADGQTIREWKPGEDQELLQISRHDLRKLINGWRQESAGHYCRTYNTGMGDGLNKAADQLEKLLINYLERTKK